MRQWGRGQTAAESGRLCLLHFILSLRQWGRGQTAAESAIPPAGSPSCAGVNGAAARRPRKVCVEWEPIQVADSVNGAAARRPRKVAGAVEALQRGFASMGPRPDGRGKVFRLGKRGSAARRQWGRGQTAAESPSTTWRCGTECKRQWGRGQTAAERRPPRRGRQTRVRVNGAAARRPRKEVQCLHSRTSVTPRQWGRGQTAAESRPSRLVDAAGIGVNGAAARRPRKDRTHRTCNRDAHASMGPRPDGRGKLADFAWLLGRVERQWGRGQTAAERANQRPRVNPRVRVNGAAARRPRKAAPANAPRRSTH